MNIVALHSDDLSILDELRPQGWGDIKPSHRLYFSLDFCYPHKVIVDNKVVGIGTAIVFNNSAWLAHIIVHPDYRKRGIGQYIVKSLNSFVEENFHPTTISLIATDLGFPVYVKEGFTEEMEYHFFTRNKDATCSVTLSKNIIDYDEQYFDKICKLDYAISGEDRSTMFSNLLKGSKLYIEDSVVKGAYLENFNEGLIIALDEKAGIELLKVKIYKRKLIVIPVENKVAIDFVTSHSYHKAMVGRRMVRGKSLNWNPKNIFSRAGGNIG